MCLKINRSVKTPWHRPSIGVARSGLWAPDRIRLRKREENRQSKKFYKVHKVHFFMGSITSHCPGKWARTHPSSSRRIKDPGDGGNRAYFFIEITSIFTSKVFFSSWSLWNGFSYFMSSLIVLKNFSFVNTTTTTWTVVIIETFRSTFHDSKRQTCVCTTWPSFPFAYCSLLLHKKSVVSRHVYP